MKSKLILSISALALSLFNMSCLKDDDYALDPKNAHNVIEWKAPAVPTSAYTDKYTVYIPKTLENVAEDELEVGINWAGPDRFAPQDITVTLEENSAAAKEAGFVQLASDTYEVPTTVTIKKGETVGKFKIKLKPSKFNGDLANALAITIKSSNYGIVSGNNGTIILSLPVKNITDGVYTYTTSAATALVPNHKATVELRTISSTKSRLSPGLLATYSNQVDYIIDPKTNIITVEMTTLLPIGNFPESKFDPATKTLNVKWTSNGGARLFEETFVFLRAR